MKMGAKRALAMLIFSVSLLVLHCQANGKQDLGFTTDIFQDMSLIGIVQEIAYQHPDVVQEAVDIFLSTIAADSEEAEQMVYDLIWNGTLNFTLEMECPLCKSFISLIKVSNYSVLEEAVIDLCIRVGEPLGIRVEELCPGTIKLQGPHIARVAGDPTVTPEESCEYINACFPDEPAKFRGSMGRSNRGREKIGASLRQTRRDTNTRSRNATPKQDLIKVVQLTDIHVERNYAVNSLTDCGLPVCCLEKYGPGDAGPLGDYNCNIPRSTIELFLERVKTFEPDIIFFSGDIPPHTVWEETPQSQMACTEVLVETIARNLSGHTVYPIIGNHEMYPTNLYSLKDLEYTQPFIDQWESLWQPLANFSTGDVQESGSYSIELRPGLRIITFNSNYMYTFNWYNVLNDREFPPAEAPRMRSFLTQSLDEAKANGEKVILVGHHPPGGSDYLITGSRWFEQLVVNYSDVIVLMPAGHTHTDEYRLIYDSTNQAKGIVYVAPSMSAGGSRNPSMRVYHLDAVTYEVIDYDHYFLDLRSAIAYSLGKADTFNVSIQLLYSAKAEYGLADLSPQSWDDLLERFKTDPELLEKHIRHSNADSRPDSDSVSCDAECLHRKTCRMRNAHYDEYEECLDEPLPPTVASTATPRSLAQPWLAASIIGVLSLRYLFSSYSI